MTSFKAWTLLFLLPLTGNAQETSISGTSSAWSGFTVDVSLTTNPISGETLLLDRDTVDADGNFELSFEIDQISHVRLSVNRFTAPLFVEPGESYTLDIEPSREFALIPTWRPGSFEYVFRDLDSIDVNAQILDFENDYYSFFDEHAKKIGTTSFRQEVKSFESSHMSAEDNFVKEYIRFSIAEMKLASGFDRNKLYLEYLQEAELSFRNPAFHSFFNSFYADYFDRYDVNFGGASISNQLAGGLTYDELDSLLLRDEYLEDKQIRQWVLLKSIKETIYLKPYPGGKLAALLPVVEKEAVSDQIEQAAKKIKTDYQKKLSANLRDIFPAIKNLDLGEKPTFIAISQAGSNERTREASILTSLLEEYGDYFSVIELFLGSEVSDEGDWQKMKVDFPEQLLEDLEVYNLPWYGWMESDGKLTKNLNKPSIDLEERLYSIRAKAQQEKKIKVGQ